MGEDRQNRDLASASGPRAALTNLQVLRALAAFCVVVFHASHHVSYLRRTEVLPIFDGRFGLVGVSVFFAISGFLMARLSRTSSPDAFLAHRVLRIFPAYLAATFAYRLLGPLAGIPVQLDPIALTLAPAGPRIHPLGIEWTLVFETSFYLLITLVMALGQVRRLEILALGWIAVIAAGSWLLPARMQDIIVPPAYLVFLSPACFGFAGGLLLPWAIERRLMPPVLILVALPLLMLTGGFSIDGSRWIAGFAAILLVGAAVQARQIGARGPAARAAVKPGDWSYALYLVHVPTIVTVSVLAPKAWSSLAVWLVAVSAALVVGSLLGIVELHAYRRLRRFADATAPRWRKAGGMAFAAGFVAVAIVGTYRTDAAARLIERAGVSLARLSPDEADDEASAVAAIREEKFAIPGAPPGASEGLVTASDTPAGSVSYAKGWVYDPNRPDQDFVVGIFCGGIRVALGRPLRIRPDLPGGDRGPGRRRVGYLLEIKPPGCPADAPPVAVAVDEAGLATVLPSAAKP